FAPNQHHESNPDTDVPRCPRTQCATKIVESTSRQLQLLALFVWLSTRVIISTTGAISLMERCLSHFMHLAHIFCVTKPVWVGSKLIGMN
ncbi:uncharacterized protein PgNI_03943, partial [Pyricularia grisea]|uniref:Uncharacterized protein n=1 Tax=Pyricularia grisea TaxID=148305 RepID=A0A6P8B8W8_PYRGI